MEYYEEIFDEKSKNFTYQKKMVNGSKGIIGFVGKYQGATIVEDLKNNVYYDSTVDIYSILPVYTLPILKRSTFLAILYLVRRKRMRM